MPMSTKSCNRLGTSDVAESAFKDAVEIFNSSLTCDECKRIWLEDKTDMKDVLNVVAAAKAKYSTRQHAKAYSWLQSLSLKIAQYDRVLEGASHPDYVALVWGAIKLAFIGILHYAELIKELAKALCQIADVLPQAENKLLLYPTEDMKRLLANLNAKIIVFAQRAAIWYKESKSKHFVNAILRPHTLRFKDVMDDVSDVSFRIDRLALTMAMVELRETRLELQNVSQNQLLTHEVVADIRNAVEEYHTLQYTGIMDTNQRVCDIQFSQIIELGLACPLADPETVRQFYTSRRNLRSRRTPSHDKITRFCVGALQQWANCPNSCVMTIRGNFQTRYHIRDLAINIIDEVSSNNMPVVWALQSTKDDTKHVPVEESSDNYDRKLHTTKDVLKQIVAQLLQQNHSLLNERSVALSVARFQSATTEIQWFNLLGSILEGMAAVYVVIDVDVLASAARKENLWPEAFSQIFDELNHRNVRTKVKAVFLSGGGTRNEHLLGEKGVYCIDLPKIRSGRVEKRYNGRTSGRRPQQRPSILVEEHV